MKIPHIARVRLMRAFLRALLPLSRSMEGPLLRAFAQWGREAEAAYRRHASPKAATPGDAEIARAIMSELHADLFTSQVLRPIYTRHYGLVAGETLDTFNRLMGMEVMLSDAAERKILRTGGTRAGLVDVRRATFNNIHRLIAEGRASGAGVGAVARAIREQVPAGRFTNAGPKYRAQLIARTETKYAQNVSSLQTYRIAPGITQVMAFDAQGDGAADDECVDRDGQVFSFDDADQELASEHPGGTLSFAPVA